MHHASRGFATSASSLAPSTVEVPQMGDSITEGSIAAVLKAPGDAVAVDEVVAQIETDKVTIDVRSPIAGTMTKVLVSEGDTVNVGQAVAEIEEGAAAQVAAASAASASAPAAETETPASKSAASKPVAIEVPQMGDSITEGAVAALVKAPGESAETDEVIAQIETDKVTIDVKAPSSGTVREYSVAEGDTVTVGQKIATFVPGAAAAAKPKAVSAAPATAAAAAKPAAKPAPAPPAASAAAPAPPKQTPPPTGGDRTETRVKMTRLRLRVSERLKSAQNTYAMLTTFNEINMSNLMAMRAEYKDAFTETHGVKLGFMSCFIKAASKALRQTPAVNAIIDGDEIVYRNYYDVSIAVSAPKGLVVPVLRDVDAMSFADVEAQIAAYGKKAREGTLSLDEMTGGTFTISNGGVFGSLNGTPIINPPQSAILGMHSIVKRPICVGNEIVARPMMNVALTYDHRLVDGREAVTFLKTIKEAVEDPRRLLLDL
jgi:2-oxoglutarate dehydrogenase E2 component (dihydrolipoamide succinyltransferase)